MTGEQQDLVVRHMSLVRAVAFRYYKGLPYELLEECIQEGYVGLCRAALRYTPGGTASFASFAGLHVLGSMRDFLRGPNDPLSRDHRREVGGDFNPEMSYEDIGTGDDEGGGRWIDTVRQTRFRDPLQHVLMKERFGFSDDRIFGGLILLPRQQMRCVLMKARGYTTAEMAREMGVAEHSCRQYLHWAYGKLRHSPAAMRR